MREIAEAAGVTKPLIFYHFESKQALFSSLLREAIETCRVSRREILSSESPSSEKLRAVVGALVELARRGPAVYAFAYEVLTMPGTLPLSFDYKTEGRRIFEDLVGLIEEGQVRGEFRSTDARAVAALPLAALGMYVSAVLSGELEAIPEGLEDSWFHLLMQGLEVRG